MSHKSGRIAERIARFEGGRFDAHYLGYFDCFNLGQFYEAHDVLEELWLRDRHGPTGNFYKGLIQLAGAFVHLQKERLQPAGALFRLSRKYLGSYSGRFEGLQMTNVVELIESWLAALEATEFTRNPLRERGAPGLQLVQD